MSEPAPPVASAGGGEAEDGTAGNPRGRTRRVKNRRHRRNVQIRSRLQIACWNAEGLRRKRTELQGWMSVSHIDVVAIQEAQFQASGPTEAPGFQTVAVFRRARGRRDSVPAKGATSPYTSERISTSAGWRPAEAHGGHHYRSIVSPVEPNTRRPRTALGGGQKQTAVAAGSAAINITTHGTSHRIHHIHRIAHCSRLLTISNNSGG